MKLPNRHSLLWKLSVVLVAFCLVIIWLSRTWGQQLEQRIFRLSPAAQSELREYADQARQAWAQRGKRGIDDWLQDFMAQERVWATVVGDDLQPLGSRPLDRDEVRSLTFVRQLDMPMSRRAKRMPYISVPLGAEQSAGQLVLQLPSRLFPSAFNLWPQFLLHGLVPSVLALLLGVLLYRMLIAPLSALQRQANALRGDNLEQRVTPAVSARGDEFGDLGRAFDHMTDRLTDTVAFQRNLLRSLSHELRTPLSRLQVANENELDNAALRERLNREIQVMRHLVDDTLELVWLDTERPRLPLEPVEVGEIWGLVQENACFESGWQPERLPNTLAGPCTVLAHLNGLAQALENILRNAIRHSPAHGRVRLGGIAHEHHWHLWIDDDGPGVAEQALESIFEPFVRLNANRPGGDGFGLGLAIARSMVRLQGGDLWAENRSTGLRLNLRLRKQPKLAITEK
jgi:two-component system sensor histidine kinase PfeS